MSDGDRKPPARTPPRDFARPKTPAPGVVSLNSPARGDITGVYKDPLMEIQARAQRIQHVTETSQLALVSRLDGVEGHVADLQARQAEHATELASVKTAVLLGNEKITAHLKAQDTWLGKLVDIATGNIREQRQDQVHSKMQRRERITAFVKSVFAILGPVLAAVFATIHWGHC